LSEIEGFELGSLVCCAVRVNLFRSLMVGGLYWMEDDGRTQ